LKLRFLRIGVVIWPANDGGLDGWEMSILIGTDVDAVFLDGADALPVLSAFLLDNSTGWIGESTKSCWR
jgi:hypothetical protein